MALESKNYFDDLGLIRWVRVVAVADIFSLG